MLLLYLLLLGHASDPSAAALSLAGSPVPPTELVHLHPDFVAVWVGTECFYNGDLRAVDSELAAVTSALAADPSCNMGAGVVGSGRGEGSSASCIQPLLEASRRRRKEP